VLSSTITDRLGVVVALVTSTQIYRPHGFLSDLCEICYFMGAYCLNMNVIHYSTLFNMKVVCTTFVCI
jgi:hypothetical protein